MDGFIIYDLVFLIVFVLFVIIFLSTRRKNLERQGILYLYKTQLGIKFIDKFAKKFEKILKPMQYLILVSGYILTVSILWMLIKTTYMYIQDPLTRVLLGNTPPVFPLIPYFPQIFGLESYLPPLYFTYFIIALAVVAIGHEFSHGIFARLHNLKIQSTGFAFLGPILGAFVEPDEKQMQKAKKFPQMVILAAGTFANILMAAFFGIILIIFFAAAFHPAGVVFDSYALAVANTSQITVVGNSSIEGFLEVNVLNQGKYFIKADNLERSIQNGIPLVYVYDDSPAFRVQMEGAISEINGEKIKTSADLSRVLQSYKPGDEVVVKTSITKSGRGSVVDTKEYDVVLGEKDGKTFLGLSFFPRENSGVMGFFMGIFSKFKDPLTQYETSLGDFGWFIYYLLWWIIVINFFVALFNMLPLGILDGGRFFLLTVWAITGKESIGKKAYKLMGWFLLLILVALMVSWAMGFF